MFQKLVLTGKIELLDETVEEIGTLTKQPFQFHNTEASNDDEMVERIGDADGVLLGWGNKLSGEVLKRCPNVKYIGMCASSTHLVDLEYTSKNGINAKFLTNYGSEATVEFIFCELLNLFRNHNEVPFDERPRELHGKTIGLIGVGDVGLRMIPRAEAFGMNVLYAATSEKPELKSKGYKYLELGELAEASDIVSLHVPRGVNVLNADVFAKMGEGKVLVNTCLGEMWDLDPFSLWIQRSRNFCIMDRATDDQYKELYKNHKNVFILDEVGGKTYESRQRLGRRLIDNMKSHF